MFYMCLEYCILKRFDEMVIRLTDLETWKTTLEFEIGRIIRLVHINQTYIN